MKKSLPLLYSRTSKGQVQTWQITIDGDTFYTEEGIKGGAITQSKPTICKAKSVGRANETTPEQQAESEAQSKWQKKIDGGYFENEADIDNQTTFWPMLAHKWKEYKDETLFPVYSQAKLDGMRCAVKADGMWSREGKPVKSAPHIYKFLKPAMDEFPGLVFDGELYNHALKHSFNKIISLAKKQKPTPEQLVESAAKLEYWIYDCFNPADATAKFIDRFEFVKKVIKSLGDTGMKIRFVWTKKVENEKELDALFEEYINEGFEGQMIRWNEVYQNKRTKFLLKRKDFIDEEFELVDLEDGDGNRAGLATAAYFKHPKGSVERHGVICFKAGVIGNNEYTADLLKNKKNVLGKQATVCYFNLTPDGVPRFGKMKILRDYE